jgi:hypothetical protein
VPDNPITCGLVAAPSVNVSVPVAAPAAAGENVTPTVQLAPAAMLAPQVLLATLNPALVATPLNESATPKRFVSVTVFAELVVPRVTVPKLNELVEKVTGALPVPERLTVCGLLGASSENVRVPVAEPTAVGENVTPTVQFAPAAILAPQVLLATANPALATMLVKLSATVR